MIDLKETFKVTTAENEYLHDAGVLIRAAQRQHIGSDGDTIVPPILLYALGIERILKGVLHALNPLYVYKDASFAHSVTALYSDRLLDGAQKSKELATNPNHDTITFREALRRVALLSSVARHNSAALYRIASVRDTIAHCLLSELDLGELVVLTYVASPQIITQFEDELGLPRGALDGSKEESTIQREERLEAEARLERRLQDHASRWASYQANPEYKRLAEQKTVKLSEQREEGRFFAAFDCPACHNTALIHGEVDYDVVDGDAVPQGTYPIGLECAFCDLRIEDTYELDKVGAAEFLYARK